MVFPWFLQPDFGLGPAHFVWRCCMIAMPMPTATKFAVEARHKMWETKA